MTLQEKYGDRVKKKAQESEEYWKEMKKEIKENLAPNIGEAINSILDEAISSDLSSIEYRHVPRRIYSIYYRIDVGDSFSMKEISLVYSCFTAEVEEETVVGAHSKKFLIKNPLISSVPSDRTNYINRLYEAISVYLKSEYAIESKKDITKPLPFIATVKFS